jgi:hypothetical protein
MGRLSDGGDERFRKLIDIEKGTFIPQYARLPKRRFCLRVRDLLFPAREPLDSYSGC